MSFVLFILFSNFIFSDSTSVEDHTLLDEDPMRMLYATKSSPFFACRGPRQSLSMQVERTGFFTREAPGRDRAGHSTADFFRALQQKVETYTADNVELSTTTETCLRSSFVKRSSQAQTQTCRATLHWINPRQFQSPRGEGPVQETESLFYAIDQARLNLSLAHPNVGGDQLFQPNKGLEPHGFKSVSWSEQTPGEVQRARSFINENYKSGFMRKYNLTAKQLDDIVSGKAIRLAGQSKNSMWEARTASEPQHVRSEILRQMKKIRAQHLNSYRAIVSEYPIINYLSSSRPSATEIAEAAKKLKDNASKEHAEIKELGEKLAKVRDGFKIPAKFNRLMQYRGIVEEVLMDNPHFCAVATSAVGIERRRKIHKTLFLGAPLLAASFFAPPLALMLGAAGASSIAAVDSYQKHKATQQAAYSTVINDGLQSANQFDVEKSRKALHTDLAIVPTAALGFGAIAKGKQLIMSRLKTK